MLTAEKNRLHKADPSVRERIKVHITWLEQELDDINKELKQMVQDNPAWKEKDEIIQSVPGVGPNFSITLPFQYRIFSTHGELGFIVCRWSQDWRAREKYWLRYKSQPANHKAGNRRVL